MPNLLVTRDHRINTHARIRRSSTMVLVGAHYPAMLMFEQSAAELARRRSTGKESL
jgi:hypothetical protein